MNLDLSLYLVLDPGALPEGARLLDVAARAIVGGVTVIQLRDKQSGVRQLVERARVLAELCEAHRVCFIVNDRVDVALASGAHGVHLGPEDMRVEDARRIAPQLIIGGSAGDPASATALVEQGVDYLGVGAIYDARASKANASAPRGPAVIASVREVVSGLPLVGIGGIDASNARAVIDAGANGVAVIRAIASSEDPEAAARRMKSSLGL